MAIMAIKGIYAKDDVQPVNHGIGFPARGASVYLRAWTIVYNATTNVCKTCRIVLILGRSIMYSSHTEAGEEYEVEIGNAKSQIRNPGRNA
jgi:hypothetical protein